MNMNELKERYATLNEIKMPMHVRDKVLSIFEESSESSSVEQKKHFKMRRKAFMSGISGVAAALLISGVFVTQMHSKSPSSPIVSNNNHSSGLGYGVPAQVKWNGRSYEYRGWVKVVGRQIGKTEAPGYNNVFSIPGKNPSDEIAVELDYPNGKYISAVRSGK